MQATKGENGVARPGKIHHYEITSLEEYEKLKEGISTVLDDILKKLKSK